MRHGRKEKQICLGALAEEWPLHRECNDSWCIQGLIHDVALEASVYAFSAKIDLLRYGIDAMGTVSYDIVNIPQLESTTQYACIPHVFRWQQHRLSVDEESLLFEEGVQMLLSGDSLALRMQTDQVKLDLCLDYAEQAEMMDQGKQGMLLGRSTLLKHPYFLRLLHMPRMKCYGRLLDHDLDIRVEGRATFQRLWGDYAYLNAQCQGEQFTLLMYNGDELIVAAYPISGYTYGGVWSPEKKLTVLHQVTLSPMEYIEIDEWRFAKGWKIELSEYSDEPMFLIPLIDKQYTLPAPQPIASVLNSKGERLGAAFCQLSPGARNELKRIPLKTYRK